MALIVITGGARCGKSAVAERLAYSRYLTGSEVCVAVFGNPDGADVEFAERIKHHRENRPSEFETLEAFCEQDWLSLVDEEKLLVIDCLGTALSAMMATAAERESSFDSINAPCSLSTDKEFKDLLQRIVNRKGDTIVVTNECGNGLVPEYESGRIYRDLMTRANRYLVNIADASYLCVCGRLIELSTLPQDANWPID